MTWLVLIVAIVIAALIVEKSKLSNWMIVPVTVVVIVAWYVALWVLKVALMLLVPVLVIGAIVYGYLLLSKESKST